MDMAIDHLTLPVRDYAASKGFFERALRPLGYVVLLDWPDKRRAHLGLEDEPSSLWLTESYAAGTLELTFSTEDADAVDAFHSAAVAAGARSDWAPAVRPEYSRDYYSARVLDPDGNSIEAVYRGIALPAAAREPVAA
jgi:catechol 2,3-dioxygenase-like lactoylglutathione lyase family enzyme